jgi:hypothetical protein
MTTAAPPPTDLKDALAKMRASVAAHGKRRGPARKLQEAILGFLETLLALIEAFRAGRLAAPAPAAEGGNAAPARPVGLPTPEEAEAPRWFSVESSQFAPGSAAEDACGAGGAVAQPAPRPREARPEGRLSPVRGELCGGSTPTSAGPPCGPTPRKGGGSPTRPRALEHDDFRLGHSLSF